MLVTTPCLKQRCRSDPSQTRVNPNRQVQIERPVHPKDKNNPNPCPRPDELLSPAMTSQIPALLSQPVHPLDGKTFNLVAEGLDLASQLTSLVGVDASSNDGTAHTAGAAQEGLAGNVDVRSTLVLAEEGDVQKNSERFGVGGQDSDFASATVKSLGHYKIVSPQHHALTINIFLIGGKPANALMDMMESYLRWRPSSPGADE